MWVSPELAIFCGGELKDVKYPLSAVVGGFEFLEYERGPEDG